MRIKYTGPADSYELAAADFKKAGVEGARKVRFTRDEVVEVDDEVGQAILSNEGAFAGFNALFSETDEEPSEEPRSSSRKEADDSEMTESGRPSTSSGTGGRGGRARGGSTTSA